jgi:hypothetical protein
MKADKKNGTVCFNDATHTYWDENDNDKKFISVTTLIEKYGQPFDKEFWSAYKALEKLIPSDDWKTVKRHLLDTHKIDKENLFSLYDITDDAFNKEQQSILDEWDKKNREACERGTKIHSEIENSFYKKPTNINLNKFKIGGKFECKKDYTDLDLPYGVYPEYLISRSSPDGILNIAGQIDLIVKSGNDIYLIDHKGLPLDTPILTSNGWSTISDLKVGDKVFDKDGNLCNITIKSEIHHNPCYKIIFDNHENIIADADHRWLISFKLKLPTKAHPDGFKHQIMTTKELKTYLESLRERNIYNIPKILNAKPLNTLKTDLPIDPYILGAWLGSGANSCGIITQSKDSELWEIIKQKGFEISPDLTHDKKQNNTESHNVYGLCTLLNKIGVLNNKHIPEQYLLASYEDRLQLLKGLMDTNGYFHSKYKRYVITTSFERQMKGVKQLLSSLGCKVSVFKETYKCDGKEFPKWNINFITNNFNPFLCRNQEIKNLPIKDIDNFRNIESVEEVDMVPTQCIAVDSPSHTYLCTHSLIVTHNTNNEIKTKGTFNSKTKGTINMKYPLNNLPDVNFYHYSLQLSTYAWMLQKINPDFVIKDLIINHYDHDGNNTLYHCDYLKHEVELMLSHYKKELRKQKQREKYKRIEY